MVLALFSFVDIYFVSFFAFCNKLMCIINDLYEKNILYDNLVRYDRNVMVVKLTSFYNDESNFNINVVGLKKDDDINDFTKLSDRENLVMIFMRWTPPNMIADPTFNSLIECISHIQLKINTIT